MSDRKLDEGARHDRKKKVGYYVLGKKLGEGRYTTVRMATHNIAQEKVAVRVIQKKVLAQKESARRHFRRQALLSQYVDHPNIVRLYEAMETSNSYYLVLELADRGPFSQYLAQKCVGRRCLNEDEARMYTSQLVSAVDHLHVSGIIHRDLRLDNFLLDKDFNLKICDFGQGSHLVPGASQPTQGVSPAYCAPEVFNGKLGGPAVDIWSIGVCVYTMLTGKLPFVPETHSSIQQIHSQILQGCQLPESLSQDCKDLLCRLLEPFDGKRINMDDLLVHPWLTSDGRTPIERVPTVLRIKPQSVDLNVVNYLCQCYDFIEDEVVQSVTERKIDSACAAYHLMLKHVKKGFLLHCQSDRLDTTTSHQSTLTSSDSSSLPSRHCRDYLPQMKPDSAGTWNLRPVSYKSSLRALRENRVKKSQPRRPKSFDPQAMPSVNESKSFVTTSSKHRLPDIVQKVKSLSEQQHELPHGTYGRHRDAWKNTDDVLNIRGTSPGISDRLHLNYDFLTPQVFGFEPPAPPNTAHGKRNTCIYKSKSESNASDVNSYDNTRKTSVMFSPVNETIPNDTVVSNGSERQHSWILNSLDTDRKVKPISYVQPLSKPKQLITRDQRTATMAVFRKITEQNAMDRLRSEMSPRPNTAMTTESMEQDDFLNPIIKVTISTYKI